MWGVWPSAHDPPCRPGECVLVCLAFAAGLLRRRMHPGHTSSTALRLAPRTALLLLLCSPSPPAAETGNQHPAPLAAHSCLTSPRVCCLTSPVSLLPHVSRISAADACTHWPYSSLLSHGCSVHMASPYHSSSASPSSVPALSSSAPSSPPIPLGPQLSTYPPWPCCLLLSSIPGCGSPLHLRLCGCCCSSIGPPPECSASQSCCQIHWLWFVLPLVDCCSKEVRCASDPDSPLNVIDVHQAAPQKQGSEKELVEVQSQDRCFLN